MMAILKTGVDKTLAWCGKHLNSMINLKLVEEEGASDW